MNATALNAASIQPTGPSGAAAGAGVQGTGTGPLAGFEALLAALFPTGAAPTPPATTVSSENGDAAPAETAASDDDPGINPEAAFADLSYGTANANLLAGVISIQTPISALVPTSIQAPSTGDPSVATRGVAPILTLPGAQAGAPAAPAPSDEALEQGSVVAANLPAEEAQPATAVDPGLRSGKAAETAPAGLGASNRAPAPANVEPTPSPRATAQAGPVTSDTSAPEAQPTPSTMPTGATETAVQAAGLQGRAELPAPAARTPKSDRAKATSETTPVTAATQAQTTDAPDVVKPSQALAANLPDRVDADEPRGSDKVAAAESPDGVLQSEGRATSQSLAPATLAGHGVRGSPETVATLAAQIIKKLEGQSTRFDLELNPGGLGKVDVRIDIGAHGRITAAMTFDNPQAASDLKARANELQRAMEQAGFDMSGGMSFDVAGDRGHQQQQAWRDQTDNNQAFRGQAFRAALDSADAVTDAAVNGALRLRRGVTAGLDLRI